MVDCHVGDVSGFGLCEVVRENEAGQGVKLFLFIVDDRPEVRDKAMAAGTDVMVLKSPEAAEIVNIVHKEFSRDSQEK